MNSQNNIEPITLTYSWAEETGRVKELHQELSRNPGVTAELLATEVDCETPLPSKATESSVLDQGM